MIEIEQEVHWSITGGMIVNPEPHNLGVRIRVTDPGVVRISVNVSGTLDGTEIPCTVTASYSFTVFTAKLKSVSYGGSGYHMVSSDRGETEPYDAPHLLDANLDGDFEDEGDRMHPVCYVRDSQLVVDEVLVHVDSGNHPLPPMTIVGGSGSFRVTAQTSATGGGLLRAGPMEATEVGSGDAGRFSNAVGTSQVHLAWRLQWGQGGRTGSTESFPTGLRTNKVYLVAGTPVYSPLLESVLHIGCEAAAGYTGEAARGQTADQQLLDLLWQPFAERSVRHPRTGKLLSYYKNWNIQATRTRELLAEEDGQCGAWCDFLLQVMGGLGLQMGGAHLILRPSAGHIGEEQRPPVEDRRFLIQNWSFVGDDQPDESIRADGIIIWSNGPRYSLHGNDWEYNWSGSHFADAEGVPGQGNRAGDTSLNINPLSYFHNHQVVRIEDQIYDPSYGRRFNSIDDWEDQSVLAHGIVVDGSNVEWFVRWFLPGIDIDDDVIQQQRTENNMSRSIGVLPQIVLAIGASSSTIDIPSAVQLLSSCTTSHAERDAAEAWLLSSNSPDALRALFKKVDEPIDLRELQDYNYPTPLDDESETRTVAELCNGVPPSAQIALKHRLRAWRRLAGALEPYDQRVEALISLAPTAETHRKWSELIGAWRRVLDESLARGEPSIEAAMRVLIEDDTTPSEVRERCIGILLREEFPGRRERHIEFIVQTLWRERGETWWSGECLRAGATFNPESRRHEPTGDPRIGVMAMIHFERCDMPDRMSGPPCSEYFASLMGLELDPMPERDPATFNQDVDPVQEAWREAARNKIREHIALHRLEWERRAYQRQAIEEQREVGGGALPEPSHSAPPPRP